MVKDSWACMEQSCTGQQGCTRVQGRAHEAPHGSDDGVRGVQEGVQCVSGRLIGMQHGSGRMHGDTQALGNITKMMTQSSFLIFSLLPNPHVLLDLMHVGAANVQPFNKETRIAMDCFQDPRNPNSHCIQIVILIFLPEVPVYRSTGDRMLLQNSFHMTDHTQETGFLGKPQVAGQSMKHTCCFLLHQR